MADEGDLSFAAALHGRVREQPGNLFYSPASVRIALAMAAAGARGETRAEMQRVLALPADAAAAFARLLREWDALGATAAAASDAGPPWQAELRERKRIVLRVVNRLWADARHPFADTFVAELREAYLAPPALVDFRGDTEAARAAINEWVAAATEHKITELIGRRVLTSDTRMVLTNAIYFKARWQQPFEPALTQELPFHVDATWTVPVPMMHDTEWRQLARVDGAMVLELPYGDGRLAMDIILPTERDGLARVEAAYAAGALPAWLGALGSARVDVALPRWKLSSTLALAQALQAFGMERAFRYPDADFSAIDGTRELYIGDVLHQAVVDVDEHGTEAAAATAMLARGFGAPMREPPIPFHADHPFLFVIRDTQTGVVLFVGRVVDPS